MRLIESFTLSKNGNPELNEDGYFVGDDFLAVCDGATSKDSFKVKGTSSGRFAMNFALAATKLLKPGYSAKKGIKTLQDFIYKVTAESKVSNTSFATECSIAIYSRKRKEIWVVGDISLIIDGGNPIVNRKKIDVVLSNRRSEVLRSLIEKGIPFKGDPGREAIMDELIGQRELANNLDDEYGYPVITNREYDFNKAFDSGFLAKVYKVEDGQEVVLCSDGYPFPMPTLDESEEKLMELLEKDPLLIDIYKSTKGLQEGNLSYDDRTYVRFIV